MTAWLEVDLGPGVRAGFTTVAHGNLGLGVGDDPRAVARRRRAAEGLVGGPVAWARQVHGADVLVATGPGDEVAACDAMVTTGPVGLAVLVADCVPVLLAGDGAVAVAHAGRQGLVAGVVPAVVARLAAHGSGPLRAVIGPSICGRCYEVPQSLADQVEAELPGTASRTSWGTPALDLPAAVAAQLRAHGVSVTSLDLCTRTDDRFYSHRATGAGVRAAGRVAGLVRLA